MKKLIGVTATAGLLVGAAGCAGTVSAPGAEPAKKPGVTGTVTSRTYLRMVSPSPYCRRTPRPAECKSRWVLVIRSKGGKRHSVNVSEATYKRYHLGDHYPAQAKGGRS